MSYHGNEPTEVPERPQHRGALSTSDIKPGMQIVKHGRSGKHGVYIVLTKPRFGWFLVVERRGNPSAADIEEMCRPPYPPDAKEVSAADFGLEPYKPSAGNPGMWNAFNFTTRYKG